MPYYTVIGRIIDDDDDSALVVKVRSMEHAIREFVEWLQDMRDEEELTEDDITVTFIFESETKPKIVLSPWD